MGDERSETVEDQTEMDYGIGQDSDGGGEEEEEKRKTGYNQDKPPEDDYCPICFGDFTVPCKANCGHWFCGNCILQLWEYRSRPRPCKCPLCSSAIYKLVPQVSAVDKTEVEIVDVLANIEQYNHLYADDNYLHPYLLQTLLAFIKNLLVNLRTHPERVRPNLDSVCMIMVSSSHQTY
ncbi:hypothetical protein CDL12_08332 [Handroanthus impetiginosus]|uniref:RING-type domain-containing protein n=1 Tax=Handroanthus impetiginosus TaxID=429701 RepID=A0A2G9HNA1_9LAMI|nr:hypothetical protein CDL12_08332 [Handroanthus impetiginosus]